MCRFRSWRSVVPAIAVLLGLAQGAPPAGAASRAMTETDLFRFVWIADPQIAPDGKAVVFVRVTVNDKKDGYDTALWTVDASGTGTPRPLTNGPRDLAPRWSPDGASVAFLRTPEKDGRPQQAQIYVLSMRGGEAQALTDLPRSAGAPAWSPDGTRLAFTSTLTPEDLQKKPDPSARKSDVRVITRAVYRANGGGYADPSRRSSLWTLPVSAGTQVPTRVTDGSLDVGPFTWAPDGASIYFSSTRVEESYYDLPDSDLFRVAAAGGDIVPVASIDGSIGKAVFSPDGRRVAFRGVANGRPARSYNQPDLFVLDLPGGEPRNLTAGYDYDVGGGLSGDQHAPRGTLPDDPIWTSDGRALLVTTLEKGVENLQRIDASTGAVTPVTRGLHEVVAFTASRGAASAVVLLSTPTLVGELERLDLASGGRVRLTHLNDALFSEIALTEPESIWYTSFDGTRVQTWVQKPPDFDASKKYPVILNIHGGPHAAYGYTFDHEFQWMAAKGYLVVYPNPRGSTSYGEQFANVIQYNYPGDDAKDLLAAVDEVIARGWADPQRLGVTGGSGGGVLTNWLVTQTDRFAAAVSQRSIADWATLWYTTDFTLFQPTWFRAAPWQDPKAYAARSPIAFVDRVKTPLMLIEGEQDFRTPPAAGGEQMFRALKFRRIPTVMVQFPGESHELSRSGQPWHRIERLQHIVSWFDKYLQGKTVDSYE